jgi:hypothetical protein
LYSIFNRLFVSNPSFISFLDTLLSFIRQQSKWMNTRQSTSR